MLNLVNLKNHSKGGVRLPFDHSRNEGTPSFQRRHNMSKISSQPALKNVKEVNPTTLSSPNTHPSIHGREGALPCGSSMQLARAPNPPERAPLDQSRPMTSMARQCLLCPYCSSSPNTGCSKSGFSDTHISTCLLSQETDNRLIPLHSLPPASANRSVHTPQAFPRRQGFGNTSFDATTCSFFMRKKKSSPCGPHFPVTFQCVEAVRKRTQHCPTGPSRANKFPTKVSHNSGTTPEPSRPQVIKTTISQKPRANNQP